MKRALIIAVAFFGVLALASSASAQTYVAPCFEWDCYSSPSGTCDFDSTDCSPGGGAWFWSWDFGDGNTLPWSTADTTSHYYAGGHNANVTLTIHYFGPQPDDSATCNVIYRNVIGPPQPLHGDCDYDTGCNCQ